MRQIIQHFTDDDLYKFTMCCAVIENYPRTQVRYKFNDRAHTVYPPGFAEELRAQVKMLETVVITDEEIAFMRRRCNYIPAWFYSYLKGFRYDSNWVKINQDDEGHLDIVFEGSWCDTIFLEVKVLAIVSELYYIMTGEDKSFDYDRYYAKSRDKARRLIEAGCTFSDFGTRRRASFEAQDTAIRAMKECQETLAGPGRFIGTSNVYFAMKYDLVPVGTMAHELIYDTYGWRIFSLNFSEDYANMFKGLRVDSGDNYEELDLIVDKYRSLNIDPASKQIVFSNGLDVDEAIKIQHYAQGKCIPSFGIGTHFTNDFDGVKPMNIVIKLIAVKITESWPFYCSTCKLSEDHGKYSGDPATVERFLEILHLK